MLLVRIVFIINMLCISHSCLADFSFKKIYHTFIPPKLHQETVYEKINPKSASLLTVKNECGNVTVSADKNETLVALKVTKKSPLQERLGKLCYKQNVTGQELVIEHTGTDLQEYESIDFDIIVPQKLAQTVITNKGNILSKDCTTPSRLSTTHGNIEVNNALNSVDAITHEKGVIAFINPHARVKAQTQNDNIRIFNSYHSVIAHSQNGNIQLFAKVVPSTSIIDLASGAGSVAVHLPSEVNADVYAYTERGTITSDHMITLKPQTTQLNRQAWRRLQKEVEGTLGSGEAQIKLSSMKSDIKLLEIKA